MTDTRFFAILAAMTAAAISVSAYDIDLEPDAAKRRTVTVFKSQGPQTALLYLKAPSPWVIAGSAITAQDDSLWSAVSTTPNTRTHVYQMVNAHSSQQHVSIFGFLTQPGPGPGRNPWFKATVPAVDIDWEAHSGAGHESDEDAWTGLCPVTTDQSRRSKIIVRPLKDDFGLVSGWMTLECWPTDGVRFLKEDGATALWHGASVSYSETPLTLYVDPVPEKAGPFTVTLKGDMDDAFNRPTDYLTGRAVLLDLDVDADNNGAINDADDLLEETPGGILATGTVKQVALRLAPAGLTGTLTLTAVSGGSRIRVWRDAGKTSPLTLPAEWELSGGYTFPTALYVEGIDASAAVRDVHLCLRYTAAGDQYVDDNIRLTVFKVELKEGANVVNEDDFVYINTTPQMPQLKASLKPSGLSGSAKWRLYIEYTRPDRGSYTGDKEYYPRPDASFWKIFSAGETWDIAAEFGTQYRGGKATLYCEYQEIQCQQIFHVRGHNPTETAAKAYLDAIGPWFAYCIAKHESGTQSGRTYLQFNEYGTLGANSGDYKKCPNRGAGGAPYGWGMMQLDNIELPGQTTYRSPDNGDPWAQELWSWKANCDTAVQVIARKSEMAVAYLKSIAPDGAGGYIMPPDITVSGVSFTGGGPHTPDQLEIIKRYNGGKFWTAHDPVIGWTHVTVGGATKDYTEKVLDEY